MVKKVLIAILIIIILSSSIAVFHVHSAFVRAVKRVMARAEGVVYERIVTRYPCAIDIEGFAYMAQLPFELHAQVIRVRPRNVATLFLGCEKSISIDSEQAELYVAGDGDVCQVYPLTIDTCSFVYHERQLRNLELDMQVEDVVTIVARCENVDGQVTGESVLDFSGAFLGTAPKELLLQHVVLPQDGFTQIRLSLSGVWPIVHMQAESRLMSVSLAYDIAEKMETDG